jgi:hypothetical protein
MVVIELLAGPTKELEGETEESLGELEGLLNVNLGDVEAAVLEGLIDGEGVDGGDDSA